MEAVKCDIEYDAGILIVKMAGEIDHHTAKRAREEIDTALYLYRPTTVIIDLCGVGFMDSSGLGLILGRYAKAKDLGGRLIVANPSPSVERILDLAGTHKLITIKKNEVIKK
ncbi:MAG: anti-sigma factor antagonist [Clostridia bacterium]|nr:anti-sigma factor antagonist [Clostridia bacterium]